MAKLTELAPLILFFLGALCFLAGTAIQLARAV